MKRVLIISIEVETLRLIQNVLSGEYIAEACTSTKKALAIHANSPFDLILLDLRNLKTSSEAVTFNKLMTAFKDANPTVEIVVITPQSDMKEAMEAVNTGAMDYITYPLDPEKIRLKISSYKDAKVKDHEIAFLRNRFWKSEWLDVIHTSNPVMLNIFDTVQSVAPTIATILLTGETGTGKGLIARLIHIHSRRKDKPFMSVHCGAIPDTLLESELFGHEKGAFTGAVKKKLGKFEIADSGTIFLDEIGTISLSAQIKLLQFLQDKTFCRVGGEDLIKTDVRIVAATNEDLKKLVEEGRFRKDLYYRLNVFPMEIPPLRQRLEDIPHLVEIYLKKLNKDYGYDIQALHPDVLKALAGYEWPGNIRELENILERAYILEKTDTLMPNSFPMEIVFSDTISSLSQESEPLSLSQARQKAIVEFERLYITSLLDRNKGKINISAKDAGITPRQLSRLMSRYGINKSDFKNCPPHQIEKLDDLD